MQILVTGFEPFGGHAVNPSAAVIDALERSDRLLTRVLPVVYAESGRIIRKVIDEEQPDAVMCLGLCAQSPSIQLERVAINLNDDTCGDNAGDRAAGRLIERDGPVGYWSTLPLGPIHEALRARNVPVAFSTHAGTYVCNHVFYTARRATERLGGDRPCGLVHLPQIGENGMSLPALVEAIGMCLRVIEKSVVKQ